MHSHRLCRPLTRFRKSKLRKQNDVQQDLGAEYAGSSISRNDLLGADSDDDPFGSQKGQTEFNDEQFADPDEDLASFEADGDEEIDSDEAFESGDEEKFHGYTFRGGRAAKQGQDSVEDAEDLEDEEDDEEMDSSFEDFDGVGGDSEEDKVDIEKNDPQGSDENDSNSTNTSEEPNEPKIDDRAALRKMMAEEQKNVAASLSKAVKADIEKGRAIKRQRTTFDDLLNTRIKLQKGLIATNSMTSGTTIPTEHTKTIQAAESAALNLWNTLSSYRATLQPPSEPKPQLTAHSSTPSTHLWSHIQSQETTSLPPRRTTLTKWSQKTSPTTLLPRTSKFSQTPTQQPLTSILDHQLTGSSAAKLLQKTRIPRSCAPVQAAARVTEDPSIYDDADFYTLLLRELVDQRMGDPFSQSHNTQAATANGTALAPFPGQKDPNLKVKKHVDTKASKGRKMRYTVHEKLQNFMAPDDRGMWGERQRNELFGSLLGKRVRLEEGEEEDEEGMEVVEEGLRLFG